MGRLLWACDWSDRFVAVIGRFAGLLFLAIMAVILLDVATRGRGWISSTILQELEWHLHAALCFLVFGYTYLRDKHVRIDVFRERWRPRTKAAVEIIGLVTLFMPMCIIVFYFSFDLAAMSFHRGEGSPSVTGLPYRWIIKSFQPLAFVLLILVGITALTRNCAILLGVPAATVGLPGEDRLDPKV